MNEDESVNFRIVFEIILENLNDIRKPNIITKEIYSNKISKVEGKEITENQLLNAIHDFRQK